MAPELVEWREYFITTATVAGALVGLLFVAVSLHLRVLSQERHADLHLDARSILIGYVVALVLSILPLIPQSLAALGADTLAVFAGLVATSVRTFPLLARARRGVYGLANVLFRGSILVAGDVATLTGSIGLLRGETWPIQLIAVSVILLIVASIFRTWDIVFRAARVEVRS